MTNRLIDLIDDLRKLPQETEWAELKVSNSNPEGIGKRLSALSNGARLCDRPKGYLAFGIADGTREVVGTKFKGATERVKGQEIQFWLAKELHPQRDIQFHEVDYQGKRVILIEVEPASGAPTRFRDVAYIRIGEATPKLSDHQSKEQQLWRKLQAHAWGQAVACPYVSGDRVVDLLDIDSAYRLMGTQLPTSTDAKLEWLSSNGLIERDVGKNWNILNLGAVLFARKLADFPGLTRRQLRLVQYSDASRIRALRETPVPQGYAVAFEQVIETILGASTREDIGSLRLNQSPYPRTAIREIVANALIHQDMTATESTPMVELFSDRVEVRNPGISLVDPSRFIDAAPKSRNDDVASLMRRMNICEERGSGIDRVIEAVEQANLPAPLFVSESGVTRAVLFSQRPFSNLTAEERVRACYQHACLLLEQGKRATNATLRARFGLEASQAAQVSRVFKEAVTAGKIKLADPASPKGGYVPAFE